MRSEPDCLAYLCWACFILCASLIVKGAIQFVEHFNMVVQ